jgi:hypothetical protein
MHHRSFCIYELEKLETHTQSLVSPGYIERYQFPILTHAMYAEGNLTNISKITPINISVKQDVIKTILIGVYCSPNEKELYIVVFKEIRDIFTCSYEEMPSIDPRIVKHEIKTYDNAKPF